MNQEKSHKIKKACIYEMSQLFSQKVSDIKIEAYAKMLRPYSVAQITMAFSNIVKKGSDFFPSCSRVIAEIMPTENREDVAQSMADNIVNQVLRFGRYQQREMGSYLTKPEKMALQRIGGCLTILDSNKDDMPTIRAQLRRTCNSVLSIGEVEKKQEVMGKLALVKDETFLIPSESSRVIDKYAQQVHEFEKEKQRQLAEIKTLNFDQFTPKENL